MALDLLDLDRLGMLAPHLLELVDRELELAGRERVQAFAVMGGGAEARPAPLLVPPAPRGPREAGQEPTDRRHEHGQEGGVAQIISVFQRSCRCSTPSMRPCSSVTMSAVMRRVSSRSSARVASSRRPTRTGSRVMHSAALLSNSA